jgi:hypothetical protein
LAADGEITWPSAGRFLAAYGELSMAADKCSVAELRLPPDVGHGHPGDGVAPVAPMGGLQLVQGCGRRCAATCPAIMTSPVVHAGPRHRRMTGRQSGQLSDHSGVHLYLARLLNGDIHPCQPASSRRPPMPVPATVTGSPPKSPS